MNDEPFYAPQRKPDPPRQQFIEGPARHRRTRASCRRRQTTKRSSVANAWRRSLEDGNGV
jgi:hypothetical protein